MAIEFKEAIESAKNTPEAMMVGLSFENGLVRLDEGLEDYAFSVPPELFDDVRVILTAFGPMPIGKLVSEVCRRRGSDNEDDREKVHAGLMACFDAEHGLHQSSEIGQREEPQLWTPEKNSPSCRSSRECDELRRRISTLESRELQAQRELAEAIQRYDDLFARHEDLIDRFDRLGGSLAQASRANEILQAALVGRDASKLRMAESYAGEVIHVDDDSVVVVFEDGDDLIEQTYEKSQFLEGRLPELGDRINVFMHATITPRQHQADEVDTEPSTESQQDEQPQRRKNTITGPHEF